jgi:cytoskeletal protein CcmA (bactofilin family)
MDTARQQGAYIGKGIVVTGDIAGSEDLYIDGEVSGRIDLAGYSIVVGPDASVAADLNAKAISISGTVVGNITATERTTITETGSVQGNVRAPRVSVKEGAMFGGRVDTTGSKDGAKTTAEESNAHLRLVAAS